jgi:hypothetical protein
MNAVTRTIKRLALVAACIGLLALSTAQRAEAVTHGGNATSAAAAQRAACEAMGGSVTTTPSDGSGEQDNVSTVYCTGGVAGGWRCDNIDTLTICSPQKFPLPSSGEFDPSLLTDSEVLDDSGGAESDLGEYVENLTWQALSTKAPVDSPRVAAPDDDQEQDTNKSKGKKSKKSKKGGKGRKK